MGRRVGLDFVTGCCKSELTNAPKADEVVIFQKETTRIKVNASAEIPPR